MNGDEQDVKVRPRPTSWKQEPLASSVDAKQNVSTEKPKYIDDMTLFMAWHNWYLSEQNRFLMNLCIFQNFHQQTVLPPPPATTAHWQRSNNLADASQSINNNVGVSVKVSSFKKRIAAEFIDFLFLLLVKIFVITYIFGDQYIDKFQYILVIDENTTIEDLQLTLLQALLFRVVAIAYEGYCLSGTLPFSNGGTLGKRIIGIEVMKCELVEDIDAVQGQVRVIPGGHLGALRSMIRATMKNVIISLFFPMLLPLQMMTSYNRLIYDIATGTIVVDKV